MFGDPDIWDKEAEPKPWSSDEIDRDREVGDVDPSLFIKILWWIAGGGGGSSL